MSTLSKQKAVALLSTSITKNIAMNTSGAAFASSKKKQESYVPI